MKHESLINSKDVDLAALMVDGIAAVLLLPPVASFAITAVRSITQLNEDQFKEKLLLFLKEADSPQEDKDKFLKLLDKDADKFFNRLFKVLDRIEDEEKATIVGKLFKALLQDKITIADFKELCSAVDNGYIDNLKFLHNFKPHLKEGHRIAARTDENVEFRLSKGVDSGGAQPIMALGLAYQNLSITSTTQYGEGDIDHNSLYALNNLGKKLLTYGLE